MILFYYEILEFNFWGLNKNTAKNVQIRERSESEIRESNISEIELGDQYYIKHDKTKLTDEDPNVTDDNIGNNITKKFNLSNEENSSSVQNN